MPGTDSDNVGHWTDRDPDRQLAALRSRCASFVGAYEELLEQTDDTSGMVVTIHSRRLTPLGCALQVFENQAFFQSAEGSEVIGLMTFFCTENTDVISETPTSYFYQLYRNAGTSFENTARCILQHHAERSSPFEPRHACLAGLYGNMQTALMHVTAVDLREDWRGERRLAALLGAVEDLRTHGDRHIVHPDNPFRINGVPDDERVARWEERYQEEIAVQLARRIGYLTLSLKADGLSEPLRDYLDEVATALSTEERPVLVVWKNLPE